MQSAYKPNLSHVGILLKLVRMEITREYRLDCIVENAVEIDIVINERLSIWNSVLYKLIWLKN